MLLPLVALMAQVSSPAIPPGSACTRALSFGPSVAATEVCQAEADQKLGVAAPRDSSDRTSHLQAAVAHYERAANLLSDPSLKKQVLDQLSRLFEAPILDRPDALERVLRELTALDPADLTSTFRLALLYEERGFINSAEDTLVGARRQQPDSLDPYKMLAQFYARQVSALQTPAARQDAQKGPAGEPDQNGVYRVGGSMPMPRREGVPQYPPEARDAGIQGAVIVELVVSETGVVTEAKVTRSIPLLDAAALEAVRTWRYEPTVVNGQAVPVRITATVNFTNR